MTDLELTKLCAEAMRLRLLPALPPFHVLASGRDYEGLMVSREGYLFIESGAYDPLHDDAQAMALVKRFMLDVWWPASGDGWRACTGYGTPVQATDLNRAIVECIAKLQSSRA